MKTFRILALDGGGLRGVIPVTILQEVEKMTGKPIWESFDLIAGTSTGGLIACALTIPVGLGVKKNKYSLEQILEIYTKRGKEIFPPRDNWFSQKINAINDLSNPKYSDKGVQKVFSEVLGDAKINDCLTHLLITSYDLNNNVPLIFKSRSSKKHNEQNILMYHICRATSAAPTYLPAYEFEYPNDDEIPHRLCIDGGVYINNPSLGALAEFSKYHHEYIPGTDPNTEIDYNNVHVLSVGTGTYSGQITAAQAKSKGQLFWAQNISDIMMRGVNKATDYQMREIMYDDNYLRLTMSIPDEKYSAMDNSSAETLNYIINQTKLQVTENQEQMNKLSKWLEVAGLK
jgi:patatin-like phospholipase/acyl hydrolase